MPCKVSFICQQSDARVGGWVESYYHVADQPAFVPQADVNALLGALRKLKGSNTIISGTRIVQLGGKRVTRVDRFGGATPTSGLAGGDSDYLTSSLNIFLQPADVHRPISIWMSGIPDEVVTKGGFYTPGNLPGYGVAFSNYASLLTASGSPWRVMIVPSNTAQFLIQTLGPPPSIGAKGSNFPQGATVKVIGVRPALQWNKGFTITNVGADGFDIVNGPPAPWQSSVGSKPKVYLAGPSPIKIDTVKVNFASKHNRGRPIGQHSGRRKAAKK